MEERDLKITSILPTIESDKMITLEIEKFQNETLRPILKFQNELIIKLFEKTLFDQKIDFKVLNQTKKQLFIDTILKENHQIKHFYLGIVVAFFTNNEIIFYFENKREINKRIILLLIERIRSQF